jgi:hypothetical protein
MSEPPIRHDPAAVQRAWAGLYLAGHTRRALRTAPVMALLEELLFVLQNGTFTDADAYAAARRAARLLSAFVAESDEGQPSRPW